MEGRCDGITSSGCVIVTVSPGFGQLRMVVIELVDLPMSLDDLYTRVSYIDLSAKACKSERH